MELLKRIREGEMALLNNGTRAQLQEACMIVWPHVPPPNYSDSKFYHKDIEANTWDTSDWLGAEISVTDFLREYREWREKRDKDLNETTKAAIEEIAKNQHKAFEPKNGLFSGIGNPKSDDFNWEHEDERKLAELKNLASNMGKTVRVELEDKYKYDITIEVLNNPSRKEKNYARVEVYNSTPAGCPKDVPFDVFMDSLDRNRDRIAKVIEDILNDDQP